MFKNLKPLPAFTVNLTVLSLKSVKAKNYHSLSSILMMLKPLLNFSKIKKNNNHSSLIIPSKKGKKLEQPTKENYWLKI